MGFGLGLCGCVCLSYEMAGVSEKIWLNQDYWVLCLILYVYKYSFINTPKEYVVHKTHCSYSDIKSLCQSILNMNNFNVMKC